MKAFIIVILVIFIALNGIAKSFIIQKDNVSIYRIDDLNGQFRVGVLNRNDPCPRNCDIVSTTIESVTFEEAMTFALKKLGYGTIQAYYGEINDLVFINTFKSLLCPYPFDSAETK